MTLRLLAAGIMLAASWLSASNAQAAIKHDVNIAAQGLGPALADLAQQTGIQVVYEADLVAGLEAKMVAGSMTPEEALNQLLAETRLKYEFVDARTVTLSLRRESGRLMDGEGNGTQGSFRVAQNAQTPSTAQPSHQPSDTPAEKKNDQQIKLPSIPEVLVKGSRSVNADIRRTEDALQPYVVFDREQLDRSMSPNLEEFFKTRLPMNTKQTTSNQVAGGGSQSAINLRGLGTSQTLILLDGRRLPAIPNFGSLNQADINGIPLAIIERVEVLPSTASGIYGGGATGGVINIINSKDHTGLDFRAAYGNTFRSDASDYRFDGSAGFALEGGKTHVVIAASHAASDPLRVGDRDLTQRARTLQFANNPDAFNFAFPPPLGRTTNIMSEDGSDLVLDKGTALNSYHTFVPEGYAGPQSDAGAALVPQAGQYNLDLPDDINGARQSLLNDNTINSAMLNVRRSFGDTIEGFVDVSWFENNSHSFYSGDVLNSVTLAADAPNNPFTTPIVVSFPSTGLSFPFALDSETFRAMGGVIVRLPADWTLAADYAWSRARLKFTQTGPAINDAGFTAASDGTLDVMRDVNALPLDWSPYLLPSPNLIAGPAETRLRNASLRLSKPLLDFRGGPLTVSGLVEHREEEALDAFQDQGDSAGATTFFFIPGAEQTVTSYSLESNARLVSGANARPFLQSLELQASVRRDEYETRSSNPAFAVVDSRDGPLPPLTSNTNQVDATRYMVGLSYSPVTDLALRASRGTGFLPPSISQIVPNPPLLNQFTTRIDPKRGNVASLFGPFTSTTGGNPDLSPEDSESWSVGAIFTPHGLPDFRLSLDYTRIDKKDEIASLSSQDLLFLEDFLPGRITRDPLTDEDAALGYTGGVITAMNRTLTNLAKTSLEAYDLQADYTWRTAASGDFSFYALMTWQPHFKRQTLPIAPFIDSAGFTPTSTTGNLEWRGNVGLTWARGPWTLGWDLQYFDSYFAFPGSADEFQIADTLLNQGSLTIPSQTYQDVFARYRFGDSQSRGDGLLHGTEILLGIQNLFDEDPPILATTGSIEGYSTYGDPRLRRFSVSISKRF